MTDIVGRCATCRWADKIVHPSRASSDIIDQFSLRCSKTDIDGGEPYTTKAAVYGEHEEDMADLLVSPDFGCVQYEAKQ